MVQGKTALEQVRKRTRSPSRNRRSKRASAGADAEYGWHHEVMIFRSRPIALTALGPSVFFALYPI